MVFPISFEVIPVLQLQLRNHPLEFCNNLSILMSFYLTLDASGFLSQLDVQSQDDA